MGFGFKLDTKVEVPKVEVPKVDAGAAIGGVVEKAKGSIDEAINSAKGTASEMVDRARNTASDFAGQIKGAVSGTLESIAKALPPLSSVSGAITDIDVSFKGSIEDIVLEPHSILDANAIYEETKFENGPIWIRIEQFPDEAKISKEKIRLYSSTGNFDKTIEISNYTEADDASVDILFGEAPMNETFSLEVIAENGNSYNVFCGISYGDLRNTKQRF